MNFKHAFLQRGEFLQLHPDPRGWGVFQRSGSRYWRTCLEERRRLDVFLWRWYPFHSGIPQHLPPPCRSQWVFWITRYIHRHHSSVFTAVFQIILYILIYIEPLYLVDKRVFYPVVFSLYNPAIVYGNLELAPPIELQLVRTESSG